MIPRFVNHREGNSLVYLCNLVITLSSHKYDGYLLDISKLGHLGIVIVDGIERGLIFQTRAERFISIGFSSYLGSRISAEFVARLMMFWMKCRTTYDVSVHILNLPH